MATVTLTKWGNSMGIHIPPALIKDAGLYIGKKLKIKVTKEGVLELIPIKNQQEGWLEKFNAIADLGDEVS